MNAAFRIELIALIAKYEHALPAVIIADYMLGSLDTLGRAVSSWNEEIKRQAITQ